MKYLIKWDAGYGEEIDVVECDNDKQALEDAYHSWKETAEMNATYSAEVLTKELAEEYDLNDELGEAG